MTQALLFYLLCLLGMGGFVFFLAPKKGWKAWITLSSYLVLSLSALYFSALSLGKPKPIEFVTDRENLVVIQAIFDEDHAIYLWVLAPDSNEPLAVRLPWSKSKASEVAGAQEEAAQSGGYVEYHPDDDSVGAVHIQEPGKGLNNNNEQLR